MVKVDHVVIKDTGIEMDLYEEGDLLRKHHLSIDPTKEIPAESFGWNSYIGHTIMSIRKKIRDHEEIPSSFTVTWY